GPRRRGRSRRACSRCTVGPARSSSPAGRGHDDSPLALRPSPFDQAHEAVMHGTLLGHPWALREPRVLLVAAVLGALAVALWLWRGRDRLPWPAVVVRLLALLAFATALAQPSLARPAAAGATVFVVDRS